MRRNPPVVIATVYDKRGKIIAKAINSFTKTHPLQYHYARACGEPYKAFLHAELLCLIRAKGKGYKLHVERYNKLGEAVLAKPCKICMLAIQEANIKVLSYTM